MKKILSLLSTVSLSTIITTNLIACNLTNENNKPIEPQFTPQQPPQNNNWKLINNKIILKNTGWYIIIYKWFEQFNIIKINSSKKFGNDIKDIIGNSLNDYENISVYKWKLNNEPTNLPKVNISTGKITNWNEKIES